MWIFYLKNLHVTSAGTHAHLWKNDDVLMTFHFSDAENLTFYNLYFLDIISS